MQSNFQHLQAALYMVCALSGVRALSPLENPWLGEGDILYRGSIRTTIRSEDRKWPNATVPYVIRSATPRIRKLLDAAMEQYHNRTCVRFRPRIGDADYVEVVRGEGCTSYIGRVGGRQELSLGRGCGYLGTVVHELGHAVGLFHEHNRSDRDQHITVRLQNVPRNLHHAFEKLRPHENRLYSKFDPNSVMLYGSRAFTMDVKSFTILRKDGTILPEVHEKPGLSKDDIKRINLFYGCKKSP